MRCNPPEGALYAMPRIRLPQGAIEVGIRAYGLGFRGLNIKGCTACQPRIRLPPGAIKVGARA